MNEQKQKPGISPIPFNLDWLTENFGLDQNFVKSAEFSFNFNGIYKISFNDLDYANEFRKKLKKADCPSQLWDYNKTIEIQYDSGYYLLKSAGKTDLEIEPFTLDFFEKYFDLDKKSVEKVEPIFFWEVLGRYDIYFNNTDAAKRFYNKLEGFGHFPRFENEQNFVCVKYNESFRLLKTAHNIFGKNNIEISSQKTPETPVLYGNITAKFGQFAIKNDNTNKNQTALPDKKTQKPFTLEWFERNCRLDIEAVSSAAFDELGLTYEIEFKKGNDKERKMFYEFLKTYKIGCWNLDSNNLVIINKSAEEKLLSIAKSQYQFQ